MLPFPPAFTAELSQATSLAGFAQRLAEAVAEQTQAHGVRLWWPLDAETPEALQELAASGRGLGLSDGTLAARTWREQHPLSEGMVACFPLGQGVLEGIGPLEEAWTALGTTVPWLALALEGVQARETRRGSGRIAQTVERLVRHLGGSLELGVVLPKTAESAVQALGFQRAFVGLFSELGEEGARTGEIFTFGFAGEFSGGIGVGPQTFERLIVQGEAIRFERSRDAGSPLAQGLTELDPEVAVLAPLRARGRPLGILYVDTQRPDSSASDDDARLVLALAEQAALAIDNARLYAIESRKRVAAETLREAGAALAQSLHLSETLATILDRACPLFKADGAGVYELQPDGRTLNIRSAVGLSSEYVLRVRAKVGSGVTGRAAERREVVVAQDLTTHHLGGGSRYTRQLLAQGKYPYRGVVGLPLLTRSGVFGVLTLYWEQPLPLDEDDLALAGVFAAQAALAIENARLYEEELRQERESAVLLNVNRLLGEDQSDAALSKVIRLSTRALGAGRGLLVLLDEQGQLLRQAGYNLHPPSLDEILSLHSQLGRGPRLLSRRYCLPVAGSGLIVPLLGEDTEGDELLGFLYADEPLTAFIPERILPLARSVADQIALNLTRERLLAALAREEARYRLLAEGAHDLIISADLSGTISYANPAAVQLLSEALGPLSGQNLFHLVSPSTRQGFEAAWDAALHQRRGGRVELVIQELSLEVRLSRVDAGQGLLLVARDLSELQGLAAEITRRGQALEAATSRTLELRSFLSLFTQAQEEERKRISRELHDDTAQVLTATARRVARLSRELSGEQKTRADDIRQDLDAAIESVRRFARNLRPSVLDDLGLLPALEWLAGQAQTDTRLEISGQERRLVPALELTIFRLVQEALSNVDKHAQACSAAVRVAFEDDGVRVSVVDDGQGFSQTQAEARAQAGHLGLLGLRERVELAGGELEVSSAAGQGTRLTFHLPG